jgi:hypothetical protein
MATMIEQIICVLCVLAAYVLGSFLTYLSMRDNRRRK